MNNDSQQDILETEVKIQPDDFTYDEEGNYIGTLKSFDSSPESNTILVRNELNDINIKNEDESILHPDIDIKLAPENAEMSFVDILNQKVESESQEIKNEISLDVKNELKGEYFEEPCFEDYIACSVIMKSNSVPDINEGLSGHFLDQFTEDNDHYIEKLCGNRGKRGPYKKRANSVTYTCEICNNKIFKKKSIYDLHMRCHTGEKPYKCNICDKSFRGSFQLTAHKLVHTDKKDYKCDICEKEFRYKCNLIDHSLIHTDERPYICDICTKSFRKVDALNEHKRIHTGEQPFECDICRKTFIRRTNLNAHKKIHSGIKPYTCDVCIKSFLKKHQFIEHKRTHTGEKPYTCKICNRSFTHQSTLKKHKLTHKN